jgi:5-(carboxyamino)imidazole ribonucleotide synthase
VKEPILPGATIGVLGSGQLGRMFAMSARRLGYLVHTYSPETDTPTGQISDVEVTAAYEDLDEVRRFAGNVDVITFEFENIPSETLEAVAELVPVRPSRLALHTAQHRLREKQFLVNNGFPVASFRHVQTIDELNGAFSAIGAPAVLKTAGFGYDGKGQTVIKAGSEIEQAFDVLGRQDAVLEAFVDFDREVSVVAARANDGAKVNYGVVRNEHRNHILDVTTAPAGVSKRVETEAVDITYAIMDSLEVVGVLCVEFFLTPDEKLLVNEMAPRPHNSGHFTIDACVTSQFEQQLRAVCGLPLGSTRQIGPAAMANILGDLWNDAEPDWVAACSHPQVKLHLYGKHQARPGRKMGHMTTLGSSVAEAAELVKTARKALTGKSEPPA